MASLQDRVATLEAALAALQSKVSMIENRMAQGGQAAEEAADVGRLFPGITALPELPLEWRENRLPGHRFRRRNEKVRDRSRMSKEEAVAWRALQCQDLSSDYNDTRALEASRW